MEWIGKSKSRGFGVKEVSITMQKAKERKQTSFRFGNNCFLRISKSGYIVFALVGNRIYFKESTDKVGYRLTARTNEAVCFKTNVQLDNFVGDYDLKWDSKERLNYIEKKVES